MELNPARSKAYQATAESLQSTFHEQVVEHIFIAELLQEAWLHYDKVVEVMRSEVDAYGYDLILECQGVVRHVQLKTSKHDAKTAYQKVSLSLGAKPSGCVVWIKRENLDELTTISSDTPKAYRFKLSYLFFGSAPGEKLPNLLGEDAVTGKFIFPEGIHTKHNKEGERTPRPSIRLVAKSHFYPLSKKSLKKQAITMAELFVQLFGPSK